MECSKIFGDGRFSRTSTCSLCPFSSVCSLLPTMSSLLFLTQTISFIAIAQLRALPCSLCYKLFCAAVSSRRTSMPLLPSCISLVPHTWMLFHPISGKFSKCKVPVEESQLENTGRWLPLETEARKQTLWVSLSCLGWHIPWPPIPAGAWAFREQPWLGRAATKPPSLGEGKTAACPQGWGTRLVLSLFTTEMQFLDHKMV